MVLSLGYCRTWEHGPQGGWAETIMSSCLVLDSSRRSRETGLQNCCAEVTSCFRESHPKNSVLRGRQVNPVQQGNVLFLDRILEHAHKLPYEEYPRSKKFANRIIKIEQCRSFLGASGRWPEEMMVIPPLRLDFYKAKLAKNRTWSSWGFHTIPWELLPGRGKGGRERGRKRGRVEGRKRGRGGEKEGGGREERKKKETRFLECFPTLVKHLSTLAFSL